ncbi:MAG: PAS domain-containing sensor histidine kinase [Candidatus Hodarchaeales archaeon]|jgi:PAS domain S-box-containing protein
MGLSPELISVLNAMIDPVHIINKNYEFEYLNEAFKKWNTRLGFNTNVIGKKLTEIFPFLSDRPLAEYEYIFNTGEPMAIAERTNPRREDFYNIQRIPIMDETSSKVTHIVTIIRDVSKNVAIMEALKESERKYRSLVQTMGEGVWVTDKLDRTILVNSTLLKMLNYTEGEMLGRKVTDFLSSESLEFFNDVREQRLAEEVRASTYELVFLTKNGLTVHTRVAGTALYNEENEMIGSFGVISDISTEKRFQQLQERFIGVTAHELRTPLAIISGYLELLQKGTVNTLEHQEIYKAMYKNTVRLQDLVQSVHDLTAIQANVFTINPRKTSLLDFVEHFKKQVNMLYPNRLIIVNEQTQSQQIDMMIDSDRINQVLENLIDNAAKNSPVDKIITVNFSYFDDSLIITVQDEGIGISNQKLFQLFQPFSHIPTEYSQRGTGLGLYIIKSIISTHNGRLSVFTQENKGSCFTVTIPSLNERNS